jgi:hypothetical protein
LNGQASGQVVAEDVVTGIGPVLTFDDIGVRWIFIFFLYCGIKEIRIAPMIRAAITLVILSNVS